MADPPEQSTPAESPAEPGDGERLGSILDRRRWRVAAQLAGMGDSVGSLLPLFAIGVLGEDLRVAAGAAAAYTFGALVGNVLLWGRLADRLRSPRALVVGGTAAQGGLLVLLGIRPETAPILTYAALLGACAVSMNAAFLRLVAGDLEARDRQRAVVRYAAYLERGVLFGLLFSTIALPLLGRAGDQASALRFAVSILGGVILLECALALSTVNRRRAAPRLARTMADLGSSGFVVVWAGATTPVQRVLRVAPVLPPLRIPGTPEAGDAGGGRLPDSLMLMLVSLAVLHMGFGMQGNLMGLFMRQELGLADGAIVSILLMGSVLTNVAVSRVSVWLDSIPSVQVQVGAGAVRTGLFLCYALLALVAGAGWTIAVLIPLFALSQLTWGAIVPANTRRFADLAPPSRRGEVAALQSASIGLGVVLGAAVGGMVAESIGFSAMFALSGALAFVGTLLLLRW